jgi:chromosomal replication initiation ATPase DnaA
MTDVIYHVKEIVAAYYKVPVMVLESKSTRHRKVVEAKFMLCYILSKNCEVAQRDISKLVGNMHHTSIVHAIRTTGYRIACEYDPRHRVAYYTILINLSEIS